MWRLKLIEVDSRTTFRDVWRLMGNERPLMDISIRTSSELDVEVGNEQIDARVRRFLERFDDLRIYFEVGLPNRNNDVNSNSTAIFDDDNVLLHV